MYRPDVGYQAYYIGGSGFHSDVRRGEVVEVYGDEKSPRYALIGGSPEYPRRIIKTTVYETEAEAAKALEPRFKRLIKSRKIKIDQIEYEIFRLQRKVDLLQRERNAA